MFPRFLAVFGAYCVGWIVYMIAMVLETYDGVLSLILQPLVATVVSAVFVAAALLFGLVLRIQPLRRLWSSSWKWAALIAGTSSFLLVFGRSLGFTAIGLHPVSEMEVTTLDPRVAVLSYFALLFAVANWPLRPVSSRQSTVNQDQEEHASALIS